AVERILASVARADDLAALLLHRTVFVRAGGVHGVDLPLVADDDDAVGLGQLVEDRAVLRKIRLGADVDRTGRGRRGGSGGVAVVGVSARARTGGGGRQCAGGDDDKITTVQV